MARSGAHASNGIKASVLEAMGQDHPLMSQQDYLINKRSDNDTSSEESSSEDEGNARDNIKATQRKLPFTASANRPLATTPRPRPAPIATSFTGGPSGSSEQCAGQISNSSVATDSRTITTMRISKKDVPSFAEHLRKAFPFLAPYDDKRAIQCWLFTVEAINTIRRRSFRGSALYSEIVDSFLGPPPCGHVGLNSTCLATGIERVENEAAGMAPLITSEAKKAARAALQVAERHALRRRLAGPGIITNVKPIGVGLASLLFEEPRLRRLVIPLAQQKELGLTKLRKGISTLGRLRIEDSHRQQVGLVGLVRDALVFTGYTATLEINSVKVDLLSELSHSRLAPVVVCDLADLLRDFLGAPQPTSLTPILPFWSDMTTATTLASQPRPNEQEREELEETEVFAMDWLCKSAARDRLTDDSLLVFFAAHLGGGSIRVPSSKKLQGNVYCFLAYDANNNVPYHCLRANGNVTLPSSNEWIASRGRREAPVEDRVDRVRARLALPPVARGPPRNPKRDRLEKLDDLVGDNFEFVIPAGGTPKVRLLDHVVSLGSTWKGQVGLKLRLRLKLEPPAQLMVRRANSDSEYVVENANAVKEVKEALKMLDARAKGATGVDGGFTAKLTAPAFAKAGFMVGGSANSSSPSFSMAGKLYPLDNKGSVPNPLVKLTTNARSSAQGLVRPP